ncbi:MAG: hypothetical protein Q4G59_11810, partial [Planctomycetia bacterium]|nr:hypothetical protein [Planctomycetia bacterium]
MSEQERDRVAMIDQFIQGNLTEEETELLEQALGEDVQLVELFKANVRADYLLKEKKRQLYPDIAVDRISSVVELSPEEVQEIAAEIANTPQSPQVTESAFWDMSNENGLTDLDSLIVWERNVPGIPKKLPHETEQLRKPAWFWASGISLVLCILIAAWFVVNITVREIYNNFYPPMVEVKPEDYSVRLAEMIDVVWDGETQTSPFKRGQFIDSDKISLKSGIIKLEFASGATLHLEGPTDFVVNDRMKCFCQKGQVSAHVPPSAIGFEIGTPLGKIIDQGTEFYARITPDNVQMGVITGLVEVRTKKGELKSVTVGNEVKVSPTLRMTKSSADPRQYIAPEMFQTKLRDRVEKIVQRREETERRLISEPGLLAFYSLINKQDGSLVNQASEGPRGTTAYI